VKRLHQEIALDIMRTREIRELFAAQWIEPLGNTPDEFVKFLKTDLERSRQIVKDAGIRADSCQRCTAPWLASMLLGVPTTSMAHNPGLGASD
jgi:hypothetical protein